MELMHGNSQELGLAEFFHLSGSSSVCVCVCVRDRQKLVDDFGQI